MKKRRKLKGVKEQRKRLKIVKTMINIKEVEDDMPRVRGHSRCVRNKFGRCIRKIRVSPHRRRLPTRRWRIFR